MNPMLKVSAAVLIAAMSALPAFAAVNATVVMGSKTDIVPVASLDGMIGKWGKPELDALGKAGSVTVFDANKLYTPADIKLLGQATTHNSTQWRNRFKPTTFCGQASDLPATAQMQFSEDVVDMLFHGAQFDDQLARNLQIGVPRGDPPQDFDFTGGER